MKSFFKAVATVTIFSIITRTLGFVFRIFLTRKLGAVGIGIYQMATSILGIFLTLIASGLPLTTAKLVSKYETNHEFEKRNKVVTTSLIIALTVSLIAALTIVLLKQLFNVVLTDNRAVELMIILIPSIIFSSIYAVLRGALWGKNDYFSCGLTELLEQIIRFALTFILLLKVTDFFVATKFTAIAFNVTCFISALITLFIYLKQSRFNFHVGEYKNILKSAAPITGVRVANSFVQPLTTLIIPNMLILSGYTLDEAMSSFGIMMGMTFPILFVPMAIIGSISMVLIPKISSLLAENKHDEINENINKTMSSSIFISMLFVPLFISVGDLIGIVLYSNSMSGIFLQYASICIIPITLCNITGSILNALNLEVKSFFNYLIGSSILFAVMILSTKYVGINSITIGYFACMSIISFLNIKTIKKHLKSLKIKLFSTIFKYTLISIPCSLIGGFVAKILLNFFGIFFSGLIGGGLSIISLVVLCKTFNLYDYKQIVALIKRKKQPN